MVKQILTSPNQALRRYCSEFILGQDDKELCTDLLETMYADPMAAALAAPQIGVCKRVFVSRFPTQGVFINPVILE